MLHFCSFLALCSLAGAQWSLIGELTVDEPGFTNVFEHDNPTNPARRYSLLLAAFIPVPLTIDHLYMYRFIGENLGNLSTTTPTLLSNELLWPREPSQIPRDVFGYDAVCQPDGFIVPGKNDGAVNVLDIRDISSPVQHDISTDLVGEYTDWFYHRALWKDMDGDGLRDAFICRARRDVTTDTEMVWFRHPEGPDKFSSPWDVTVMNQGLCDTFSVTATLAAGGSSYNVIFTVGYFSNMLIVHWTTDPNDRWDDLSMVRHRVIATGHRFFDVRVADLNFDGRLDLLVSKNAEFNGSLVAFQIPDDFRTGTYTEHLLTSGFNATSGVGNPGTPGIALPFHPNTAQTNQKPWILLSGDDDGNVYLLRPEAEDWKYTRIMIYEAGVGNIIGGPSTFDADGDGWTELFVPSYYEDKVLVYTFRPN